MKRSNVQIRQLDRKYVFYERMQQRLALLRQQRRLSPHFHFHYADVPRRVAQAFFEAVRDAPFSARATVVGKAVLPDTWRRMPGQWMVEHFIARTIMGARAEWVEDAVLIFDGPRRETKIIHGIRATISHLFAERELAYRPKKVTARPEAEEDGLQMADMIAGAAWDEIGGVAQGYLAQLKEQLEIVYVPDIKTTPASWGCFDPDS